ncbi:NAD-dependent epimerase/dehydratase family protein, partial [Singulisphaera rosea]
MRTIVTGGAGFIGSHLVERLLDSGGDVVALDNFDSFYPESRKRDNLALASKNHRFRLLHADIRDRNAVNSLFQDFNPDAVVHLAARAGVRPSIDDPALYADVNVLGTVNLLDAAVKLKSIPKFVYASSSSVYGDRDNPPFRESDSVDLPVSPYAATKKACELLAHTFHHLHGLPVTGLRFFTAYGPRNRPDLAIYKFASLIERGLPVPMFGDGSTRRDYTFVADIVDGIVRSVEHCSRYHIYNLGNSSPVDLRFMIQSLGEALGKEPIIDRLPEQPGDVRLTYADVSRAKDELG